MVNQYKTRPSVLAEIEDSYVAYCFDEVCAYILAQMKNGKTPRFEEDKKENKGLQMLLV